MSSTLKRKRFTVEVADSPGSVKPTKKSTISNNDHEREMSLLHSVNGVDTPKTRPQSQNQSSQLISFNFPVGELSKSPDLDTERSAANSKSSSFVATNQTPNSWKLSESIGGRMINSDPIFSLDERFLIVANRSTVYVYSTSTSLLIRSIKLKIDSVLRPNTKIIITYCLSPTNTNLLWVACSDGAIYRVDWTTGDGTDEYWAISSTGCIHMTVAPMESAGRRRDVIFTTEMRKDGGWRITANELASPITQVETATRTIYTSSVKINFLKTAREGSIIVAASEQRILIGTLRSTTYDTIDKIKYEFRVFSSTEPISCLDVRTYERTRSEETRKVSLKKIPIVDVVVGGAKGSIFMHNDLLGNLVRTQDSKASLGTLPRKFHWHRGAINSVKISLDGNYLISGGSETVLVLWQLDTGRTQFLPHMSTEIQNITISPSSSSYGIQLADNSALVLSTIDLLPTANIAGIQACYINSEELNSSHVSRIGVEAYSVPLVQRHPAVINPAQPSQLLLGVGQWQEISPINTPIRSITALQTFDLSTGHNISRQTLTRSNVTNINISPNARQISEPKVTHIQISSNGAWLATIDDWSPPQSDIELFKETCNKDIRRKQRREVYLKFWKWSTQHNTWELNSRIVSPHTSISLLDSGEVLDMVADLASPRFASLGEDGTVCIWSKRVKNMKREASGGRDNEIYNSWSCQHAISLGQPDRSESEPFTKASTFSGNLAFSPDGSTLAASLSGQGSTLLHFIDTGDGSIRLTQNNLFGGDILQMKFLGQDLIVLSDWISVYDLVSDEMKYRVKLSPSVISLSIEQKQEMVHLAVDQKEHVFAVALPASSGTFEISDLKSLPLSMRHSELTVFSQNKSEPIMKESLTSLVTALLSSSTHGGFFVLDTTAEVRTIFKSGEQAVTNMAQSISALCLDREVLQFSSTDNLAQNNEDADVTKHEQDPEEKSLLAIGSYYDAGEDVPVVTRQQLSDIFYAGPSLAQPPIEDIFYQVANLFSSKPMLQSS